MGAFMIRHWRRRIRFFYWFGVVFRGTFSSPAWVILPLWFLRELLSAHLMDLVMPGAGGGGVAYWAHVSGFAFGAIAATTLKFMGWEEKFLGTVHDQRLTVLDNTTLGRALENKAKGKENEAWTLLLKETRRDPENLDALTSLWELAVETGRSRDAAG